MMNGKELRKYFANANLLACYAGPICCELVDVSCFPGNGRGNRADQEFFLALGNVIWNLRHEYEQDFVVELTEKENQLVQNLCTVAE